MVLPSGLTVVVAACVASHPGLSGRSGLSCWTCAPDGASGVIVCSMFGMVCAHGAAASTVMLTLPTALPPEVDAVTVYVSVELTPGGVPRIVPVLPFSVSPSGNGGATV